MAPAARWKFFVERADDEAPVGAWPLTHAEHVLSRGRGVGSPSDWVVGADEQDVSRPHAAFAAAGDGVAVVDCGSRYGTFVNGARVEPCARVPLEAGDVVRAGSFLLTLAPAAAATRPARKAVLARNGTPLKPDVLLFTRGPLADRRLRLDLGPVLLGVDRWSTVRLVTARFRGTRVLVAPAGSGGHRAVDASDEPRLRVNGERATERRLEHADVLEIASDVAMTYLVYRKTRACKVVASGTLAPA